jgi:hypothetical protein
VTDPPETPDTPMLPTSTKTNLALLGSNPKEGNPDLNNSPSALANGRHASMRLHSMKTAETVKMVGDGGQSTNTRK